MMKPVKVSAVTFLNEDSHTSSLGRLGQAGLYDGASPSAVITLVNLSCQAHAIEVAGLRYIYSDNDLRELTRLKFIHWDGGDTVKLV